MTAKCTYDLIMGPPDPNWSKNERAGKIMGLRPTGTPIDFPCELDYHCPVCKYEMEVDGNPDTRLYWSEYNGFIWCEVCNRDYPSALCMPDTNKAIDIYLSTVEEAVKRAVVAYKVADSRYHLGESVYTIDCECEVCQKFKALVHPVPGETVIFTGVGHCDPRRHYLESEEEFLKRVPDGVLRWPKDHKLPERTREMLERIRKAGS